MVALIFARDPSDTLTGLVKRIDTELDEAATLRKGQPRLGVFIIFCNDDAGLKKQLEDQLAREPLKQVVLCTCNAAGPTRYRVAREADLTVAVYENRSTVAANFALKKGELNEEKAAEIFKAVSRVLPRK